MITSFHWVLRLIGLALLIGLPTACLIGGILGLKSSSQQRGKLLVGAGVGILCVYGLMTFAYAACIGPGRSGIVAHGWSPEGREYCIVQTFKTIAEPYQVSFYIRDRDGVWRWNYLAHQDSVWRSATVSFSGGFAHVSRDGNPFRDIRVPTNRVDLAKVEPGYRDDYCPPNFSENDLLSFHNKKFR